ncbi:MAG: hypothetical protein ABI334_06825 [Candidatus Dormiibacterota bacterium]
MKINFHANSQPKSFNVQLMQGPTAKGLTVDASGPQTFHLGVSPPAAAGLYLYSVTGTWAEGDVSFYLTIQLIPGIA